MESDSNQNLMKPRGFQQFTISLQKRQEFIMTL